jgi:hypothetical protein
VGGDGVLAVSLLAQQLALRLRLLIQDTTLMHRVMPMRQVTAMDMLRPITATRRPIRMPIALGTIRQLTATATRRDTTATGKWRIDKSLGLKAGAFLLAPAGAIRSVSGLRCH